MFLITTIKTPNLSYVILDFVPPKPHIPGGVNPCKGRWGIFRRFSLQAINDFMEISRSC